MQRGVKGKIPSNISPLHCAAVRFYSPLHYAAGSQISLLIMQRGVKSLRRMMQRVVNLAAGSPVQKLWMTPEAILGTLMKKTHMGVLHNPIPIRIMY